jgi:hypothetical protein
MHGEEQVKVYFRCSVTSLKHGGYFIYHPLLTLSGFYFAHMVCLWFVNGSQK